MKKSWSANQLHADKPHDKPGWLPFSAECPSSHSTEFRVLGNLSSSHTQASPRAPIQRPGPWDEWNGFLTGPRVLVLTSGQNCSRGKGSICQQLAHVHGTYQIRPSSVPSSPAVPLLLCLTIEQNYVACYPHSRPTGWAYSPFPPACLRVPHAPATLFPRARRARLDLSLPDPRWASASSQFQIHTLKRGPSSGESPSLITLGPPHTLSASASPLRYPHSLFRRITHLGTSSSNNQSPGVPPGSRSIVKNVNNLQLFVRLWNGPILQRPGREKEAWGSMWNALSCGCTAQNDSPLERFSKTC